MLNAASTRISQPTFWQLVKPSISLLPGLDGRSLDACIIIPFSVEYGAIRDTDAAEKVDFFLFRIRENEQLKVNSSNKNPPHFGFKVKNCPLLSKLC